jgi:hypothetical protein
MWSKFNLLPVLVILHASCSTSVQGRNPIQTPILSCCTMSLGGTMAFVTNDDSGLKLLTRPPQKYGHWAT